MNKLGTKLRNDERHIRLVNWARWCNAGGMVKLGYPGWYDLYKGYLPRRNAGRSIAEADAMHLEYIISTMDYCGRRDPDTFKWWALWAYVIKLDYLWSDRPVELRAELVKFKFKKRRVAKRTYHNYCYRAREAIFTLDFNK